MFIKSYNAKLGENKYKTKFFENSGTYGYLFSSSTDNDNNYNLSIGSTFYNPSIGNGMYFPYGTSSSILLSFPSSYEGKSTVTINSSSGTTCNWPEHIAHMTPLVCLSKI